jgi:hypothetical protein
MSLSLSRVFRREDPISLAKRENARTGKPLDLTKDLHTASQNGDEQTNIICIERFCECSKSHWGVQILVCLTLFLIRGFPAQCNCVDARNIRIGMTFSVEWSGIGSAKAIWSICIALKMLENKELCGSIKVLLENAKSLRTKEREKKNWFQDDFGLRANSIVDRNLQKSTKHSIALYMLRNVTGIDQIFLRTKHVNTRERMCIKPMN